MGNAVESITHKGDQMTGPKGFGYGVEIRLDNYETSNYDGVVVCAGVLSRDVASQLGDRVNIYPVKGYSITVNLNDEKSQKVCATPPPPPCTHSHTHTVARTQQHTR